MPDDASNSRRGREDWLTPRDNTKRRHWGRRRSRRERSREELLRDWLGEEAELEIEQLQAPSSPVGEAVDELLRKYDYGDRALMRRIYSAWNEVVGNEIERVTEPQELRFGTLFVAVSDPVWMMRLRPLVDELARRVKTVSEGAVTKVRLVPGGRTAEGP